MAGPDWGKQVGPMPLGAWVIVVAGGLGIALWSRNSSANPAAAYVADDTGTPDGVADGTVGGWSETTGGGSGGATGTTTAVITTNEEWAHAAIDYLIKQGYDANASYAAITKAFNGDALSVFEYSLWGAAVRGLGAPPYPVLVLPPTAVPGVSEPTPGPREGGSGPGPIRQTTSKTKQAPTTGRHKWVPISDTNRKCRVCGRARGDILQHTNWWVAGAPWVQPQIGGTGGGSGGGHPQPGTFTYYTVKPAPLPGSTLKSIAQIAYGDASKWNRIYNNNRKGVKRDDGTMGMIDNPNVLKAGWKLLIPR
jgi:hypothetical protein